MPQKPTAPLSNEVINWVEKAVGKNARLNTAQLAKGATSSSVYYLNLTEKGRSFDCVLRLFSNAEWLHNEPDLARHEAAALLKAQAVSLPTPKLLAFTEDEAVCGATAVLMSHLPGQVILQPDNFSDWLRQLAAGAAQIHALTADNFPWQYRSWTNKENLQPPAWSKYPELWQQAIEINMGKPPNVAPVFIHRDYHPVNVLWQTGHLGGVVDWVNACQGPLSVDLAHCRLNLNGMYGVEVADQFLQAYRQLVGANFVHDPYWDIDAILGILPEPGFYAPWQEFGLGFIPQEILCARRDNYLKSILKQV